jgi:hypothetical protein
VNAGTAFLYTIAVIGGVSVLFAVLFVMAAIVAGARADERDDAAFREHVRNVEDERRRRAEVDGPLD